MIHLKMWQQIKWEFTLQDGETFIAKMTFKQYYRNPATKKHSNALALITSYVVICPRRETDWIGKTDWIGQVPFFLVSCTKNSWKDLFRPQNVAYMFLSVIKKDQTFTRLS